jgi:uncharacterized protein with NAD-binding domain and iron-sulfur cluster
LESDKPIEVAVIGGGCGAMTTAFELTRPEHRGKYHVTVYQPGWRLGGKGASGRGPADRVEEHGLHVWLGFYENAFRLMRACYEELDRDPETCPIADWRDAFYPDPFVGMADTGRNGQWLHWTAYFPPADGLPGDPLAQSNPFTMTGYLTQTLKLLRTLLMDVQTRHSTVEDQTETEHEPSHSAGARGQQQPAPWSVEGISRVVNRVLKFGWLSTTAGLIEAIAILEVIFQSVEPLPENSALRLLKGIATSVRGKLEEVFERDDEVRYKWEIIDLVLAILVGVVRFRLLYDPRGFDAINEYECREWLRMNGASERSLDSAFVRGLYDLAMAYPAGDARHPALAAGQAIRGSLRMFFTYRGSLFWKMRAGMGDVVFAPLYEVLKKRGACFRFFHRLENVRLARPEDLAPGDRPYVKALDFDVQARVRPAQGDSVQESEYWPLIDVRGLPCWPARPDYSQLVDGERLQEEGWDFESFWDRRKAGTKTLRVGEHFDFVVLGLSVGAIPHACAEILARESRWRDMVEHVKTVPSQAFQVWMREDMETLGWTDRPVMLSAFIKPFDTWADMSHLISEESWLAEPRSIAYFCSVLPDPDTPLERSEADYPTKRRAEVRENAIRFLNQHVRNIWPRATRDPFRFRWELLVDPLGGASSANAGGEERFDSQFWTANVNPSDRYVLALPGSLKYRISPLDNSYDNLTVAGDWTDCGFNEGCVEAAVMSGRLAAHALSEFPALEEIIGYDHP